MKQLKFLAIAATALLAAATLSFTSCSDDDDDDGGSTTTFNVSPSSLTFDAAGGTKTLTVTGDWDKNPTTEADWLTLTTADNKITVVATAYTETTAPRTTTITVGSKTVNVSQAAYVVPTPSVTANPSSLSFNASGNSAQTVYVTLSNVEGSWTATASETWVTVTPSADSFTVNVGDNTADGSRTATITVKVTDDVKTTVSVSQKGVSSSTSTIFNGTYTASWTSLFSTDTGEDWETLSSFSGQVGTDTSDEYDLYGDGTAWTMHYATNFCGEGEDFAFWFAYNDEYGYIVPSVSIGTASDNQGNSYTLHEMYVDAGRNLYQYDPFVDGYDGSSIINFANNSDPAYPYMAIIAVNSTAGTAQFFSDGYNNLKLNYSETRSGVANHNSVVGFSYDSKLNLKGKPVKNFKLNDRVIGLNISN